MYKHSGVPAQEVEWASCHHSSYLYDPPPPPSTRGFKVSLNPCLLLMYHQCRKVLHRCTINQTSPTAEGVQVLQHAVVLTTEGQEPWALCYNTGLEQRSTDESLLVELPPSSKPFPIYLVFYVITITPFLSSDMFIRGVAVMVTYI